MATVTFYRLKYTQAIYHEQKKVLWKKNYYITDIRIYGYCNCYHNILDDEITA